MMKPYFDEQESIYSKLYDRTDEILETVANAYIGRNPALPFEFRSFSRKGFLKKNNGRYDMNLEEKLPEARLGQYAYVFGLLWSNHDGWTDFGLSCYGPTAVYLNREFLYKADIHEEANPKVNKGIRAKLQKGWNSVCIKFVKTGSGFGGIFGTLHTKWNPMEFMSPFQERKGQAGWIYSDAMDADGFSEEHIPEYTGLEEQSGMVWHPGLSWDIEQMKLNPCTRIFGNMPHKVAYLWSELSHSSTGSKMCSLKGSSTGKLRVWLDGSEVFSGALKPSDMAEFKLEPGKHEVLVELCSSENGWEYGFDFIIDGENVALSIPRGVKGSCEPWLYLGPFDKQLEEPADSICSLYRLFEQGDSQYFWRVDRPDTWVRPYLDNALFAKWNYPLGVTLYGLLQTGRFLQKQGILDYAVNHISECTRIYKYAKWDAEQYGYPSVNNQLVEMDMLDDCGSFGSAVLEAYSDSQDPHTPYLVEQIANHMEYKQERLEDGAFFRICLNSFQENTLWADDLYMSTPFLIRYYRLTGEAKYLDDAARQFNRFKKYLFIPEFKIMSHVYDFKHNKPTNVPWGRGNGWVFFSLSELLEVMPETHVEREELLTFYNELAEGYMALQGTSGLWHQVLTHPDSYEETSCTSMFVYGLSRGVRHGWIREDMKSKAVKAVNRGWEALTKYGIDRFGNVHGVCRGSGYSFTPEYYKVELNALTNDTHGIGIVLLAGIETGKLSKWLKQKN
ncbi:glycoside hydrolase family 88 protein [Paenibacillus sonchi]|nr:glycoside hydrolase family 88 protein [Paenibacillus sonchi]